MEPGSRLFVGNLSFETSKEAVEQLFGRWGKVVDCFLPTDRATGDPRGFGFVTFTSAADAKDAVRDGEGTWLRGIPRRASGGSPSFEQIGLRYGRESALFR